MYAQSKFIAKVDQQHIFVAFRAVIVFLQAFLFWTQFLFATYILCTSLLLRVSTQTIQAKRASATF